MIKISHAIGVNILALFLITGYFDNMIGELDIKIFSLENKLIELNKLNENNYKNWGIQEFNVTVTMYNPSVGQTDSTPNQTADGTIIDINRASEYRYVALSRDLIARWGGPFEYGDYVIIKGTTGYDCIYQVRDTMASKFINRVDILLTKGSKHFRFDNVTLYRYFKYDNATLHNHHIQKDHPI